MRRSRRVRGAVLITGRCSQLATHIPHCGSRLAGRFLLVEWWAHTARPTGPMGWVELMVYLDDRKHVRNLNLNSWFSSS